MPSCQADGQVGEGNLLVVDVLVSLSVCRFGGAWRDDSEVLDALHLGGSWKEACCSGM